MPTGRQRCPLMNKLCDYGRKGYGGWGFCVGSSEGTIPRLYTGYLGILQMNKAEQKSILRQFIKKCRHLGLSPFLRPKREMFELYKLRKEQLLSMHTGYFQESHK